MKTKRSGYLRKTHSGTTKKQLTNPSPSASGSDSDNNNKKPADNCNGYCTTNWKPATVGG